MDTTDTRARLVRTAMQLFWEKGYASTSIADVLLHAQVNSGSLYHFFPGKQDLLLAVLDQYHAGIYPMLLDRAWQGVSDPIEKVFALLALYRAGLVDTEYSYACPIGSLALEFHEPDLAVREGLAKNFTAWAEAIHRCLVEAGSRLPARVDRRELAHFVLTTMEGGVMQARTFRDIESFDGAVRQLRRYFDYLTDGRSSQKRRPARRQGRRNKGRTS